jgi:putative phage-type endonuclease
MNMYKLPPLIDIFDDFDDCDELITDTIVKHYISMDDLTALYESVYGMIDEFMINNLMNMKQMSFEECLKTYIVDNLEPLIYNMSDHFGDDEIESIIEDMYNYTRKEYFSTFMPPRSFNDSFIRRAPNIEIMSKQIDYLRSKPQPDQRTNEWYKFRYNLLTASSIWKTFSSQNSQNQLIYEKCIPLNVDKYNSVNTESAMHHGQKYEELSVMYYEKKYNTKMEDFGCIQHDDYYYIGASPDGINVDKSSQRYGRMLEIKNVVNREITGIPKEEYWIQMQVQMETCNLNECDFLETQFSEYESEEEFLSDDSDKMKGLLLYFMENGKPLYKYMPLEYTKYDDMISWENKTIDAHSHLTWVKTIYWRLDKVSCVLVLRNKKWFNNAQSFIKDLWECVEKERKTGYEHRAPKRSQRKRASSFVNIDTEQSGCLLDPDLFGSIIANTDILNESTNIIIEKNSGEIFTDLSFNTNIIK